MIWIDAYYRIRDGHIQHVRGHFRRWPSRQRSTVVSFKPRAA